MAYGDEIADRLLSFAVGCMEVIRKLPNDRHGRHIGDQLFRSSTSGGAQEARNAESRRDFIHKIRLSLKEVGEAVFWFRFIERTRMAEVPPALIDEGLQRCRILGASSATASRAG
jgi:four helix bundle protein